ncbi:hypothetical protein INS49_004133 [Diaporthe citri]|uniref:uncharacterized protein n=1 Tax=Diaporthe citri TaxID=83186 RepID=UPI001C7E78FB|nr:uncharacterized protein INS49_004133 [Diaporthe citri]KAG6355052.1 hypothetical protein INS49_004133 [Diaporthe citri]
MSLPIDKLPKDRLVISLDFGTTYSGVAYAFNIPGKKVDVTAIQDWPGLEGYRQPKVPTLILYDEKDPSKFKWGGQVNWRDPAVRGVKLLLDPGQHRPMYFPASTMKKDRRAFSKDPVDIAADFIGAIYKHALSVVESAGLQDYFNFCQKDFVLTVPAAAKKAGIYPVTMIKEPEAAALYTLTTHDHAIKAGDTFVLCDAGGGTVDIITYEIESIEPYLQLRELVPGEGIMAGSLGLNKRFEESVQELVGEDQFYLLKKTVGWSKVVNDFDKNIKTAFNGDPGDIQYVSFPKANLQDDFDEGLSGNIWEMTGDVLQGIFNPIIIDILRLVDKQVTDARLKRGGQNVKAIFLVGGFGSSRYLKERLERVYKPQGIQVLQPPDAWQAIVNGAVLSRLSNQATVVSTKAVRHYGVSSWNLYDPQSDHGRVTKFQPDEGKDRVEKLSWFIYMGADLKRDQTIKLPFFQSLKKFFTPDDLIFDDELLFSEAKTAPDYPGPDVKKCCTVKADLSGVKKNQLVRRTGADGKIYFDLHYYLVLNTTQANLKFSVEFKGKEMGSAEATYV